jgi:hypothetical protein
MESFFTLCAFIIGFGIIRLKGTARLILFLAGVIFLQDKISLFNLATIHQFFIYVLILAEFTDPKSLKNIKSFPLLIPLIIVFVGFICNGMFDSNHAFVTNAKKVIDAFSSSFLIMYLFYSNFKKDTDWNKFYNFILISSTILCVYGIFNYLTKSNPYDNLLSNVYHTPSAFDQYANGSDGRFRINSFTSHPIYYGYLLGVLLLFALCHFINVSKKKKTYIVAIILIFTNLLLTNSRTPLIATFFGIVSFLVLSLNENLKFEIALYTFFVCVALYNIPFVQTKINSSIDIFQSGGEKTSGSNLDMRSKQFDASYKVFLKNPIMGNGLGYIIDGLGFNLKDDTYDSDFKGFESYIYVLLIEQGLIGIISNIIFFVWAGVYFLRQRVNSKPFGGLGFSIILMFLIFITGTGAMGSWFITMGALGILIASLTRGSELTNVLGLTQKNLIKMALVKDDPIHDDLLMKTVKN